MNAVSATTKTISTMRWAPGSDRSLRSYTSGAATRIATRLIHAISKNARTSA